MKKMKEEKTVCVATCTDAVRAHIIQGVLENEGIASVLHNENFAGLYPGMSQTGFGVQLFVLESDAEYAREIMSTFQNI
jgi:hypothetical protein